MNKLRYIAIVALLGFFVVGCRSLIQTAGYGPESMNIDGRDAEGRPTEPDPSADQGMYGSAGFDEYHSIAGVSTGDFRAVWVATVLNLDFPFRQDLSVTAMRREIDVIAEYTAELGLNAVILQVRPTGDAFYRSDIFPWSHWLTGVQGQAPADFDPLEYWIEACRLNGLELHAWLNPYRVIHTQTDSSDPNSLAPDNPVRLRPELAVAWSAPNGNRGLFLDPGLPEARALIIDGIAEIVTKYDVDGVHIDDYFYPGTNFDDAASFARYGADMNLADWRRDNVNQLVRDIGAVIRRLNAELGKNVRWGVSPTAIWMNGSSDPRGVPTTSGQESYHALYADTRLWVMEEWVDYICPQIYWYIGFGTADFEAIFNWWVELCKDYDVDLYIGHAAYREAQDDQQPNWRGEMERQLEMVANADAAKGSVFYRYNSLRGALGASIRDFYSEDDGGGEDAPGEEDTAPPQVLADNVLTVGTPWQDTSIGIPPGESRGYNITGTSDPGKPLYVNGREVPNRTAEGYFALFPPIEPGENVFTFTQDGHVDVTRVITRNAPAPSASSPAPPTTTTRVTVPAFATVISDSAWVFPSNTTSGGSDWLLLRGQTDLVVAESANGFVMLSCGRWVSGSSVELSTGAAYAENPLQNGRYRAGADYDMVVWQSDVFPAAYAGFDGEVLKVSFGMHTEPPPLDLPANLSETVFASARSGFDGDTPYLAFTIRDGVRFDGHYIDYENGEFRLHLKKRKTLAEGPRPLAGVTIMLDPGHGGEEYGAIGPMGRLMPEKTLNLINAQKLAERLNALGASVHMTRSADVGISLQEIVDFNLRIRPDLFISLHVNSVSETTNAANVRGFTVWYRNPGSVEFAQTVLDIMYYINPTTNRNRNINQANFFICRPQWAPAIILEAGFIVNINDFAWLTDPAQQDRMAAATADAILEYFS